MRKFGDVIRFRFDGADRQVVTAMVLIPGELATDEHRVVSDEGTGFPGIDEDPRDLILNLTNTKPAGHYHMPGQTSTTYAVEDIEDIS